MKIFKCKHCGKMVMAIDTTNTILHCCHDEMTVLTENSTDAATEKHVPVAEFSAGKVQVKVGSIAHPMQEVHYIEWIALETQTGHLQLKYLKPQEAPEAEFCLINNEPISKIYAYCNLHGLWSTSVEVM